MNLVLNACVNCFDSADWWDPSGPFRLLHAWMPLRMRFILEHVAPDHLHTVQQHS